MPSFSIADAVHREERQHSLQHLPPQKKDTPKMFKTKVLIHPLHKSDCTESSSLHLQAPDLAAYSNLKSKPKCMRNDTNFPVVCEFVLNSSRACDPSDCADSCGTADGCSADCTCHDAIACVSDMSRSPGCKNSANQDDKLCASQGTVVVHTGWDEGVWWYNTGSGNRFGWKRVHPEVNLQLEYLWDKSAAEGNLVDPKQCNDRCDCKSEDIELKTTNAASYSIGEEFYGGAASSISFATMSATFYFGGKSLDVSLVRMCGQTSVPKSFKNVNPVAGDICLVLGNDVDYVENSMWLRSSGKKKCFDESTKALTIPKPSEVTANTTNEIKMIPSKGHQGKDSRAQLIIFGYDIYNSKENYGNVKILIRLKDSVGSDYLTNFEAECKLNLNANSDSFSFNKTDDGECHKQLGCFVRCDLPPGHGSGVEVVLLNGVQQSLQTFTLNYKPPTLSNFTTLRYKEALTLKNMTTAGLSVLSVRGSDFGRHPRLSLQHSEAGKTVNKNHHSVHERMGRIYGDTSLAQGAFGAEGCMRGSHASGLLAEYDWNSGLCMRSDNIDHVDLPPRHCDSNADCNNGNMQGESLCSWKKRCVLPLVPPASKSAVPLVWYQSKSKKKISILVGTKYGSIYRYDSIDEGEKFEYIDDAFTDLHLGGRVAPACVALTKSAEIHKCDHLIIGTEKGEIYKIDAIHPGNKSAVPSITPVALKLRNSTSSTVHNLSIGNGIDIANAFPAVADANTKNEFLDEGDMFVGSVNGKIFFFAIDGDIAEGIYKEGVAMDVSIENADSGITLALYANDGTTYLLVGKNAKLNSDDLRWKKEVKLSPDVGWTDSDNAFKWYKVTNSDSGIGLKLELEPLTNIEGLYEFDAKLEELKVQDHSDSISADPVAVSFSFLQNDVQDIIGYAGDDQGKVYKIEYKKSAPEDDQGKISKELVKTEDNCDVGAYTPSHTCIRVRVPPGVGTGLQLTLTAANQEVSTASSFRAPNLLSVENKSVPHEVTRFDTRGFHEDYRPGEICNVSGQNFGPGNLSDVADTYETGSTASYVMLLPNTKLSGASIFGVRSNLEPINSSSFIEVVTWSDTQITFRVPSGDGRDWPLELSVGGQTASSDAEKRHEMFSYGRPVVDSVSPNENVITDGRTGAELLYTTVDAKGLATAYLASSVPSGHPGFTNDSSIEILHNHPGTNYDPLGSDMKILSIISQGDGDNAGPIFTFQAKAVRGVGDSYSIVPGTFYNGFVFLKEPVQIEIRGTNFGQGVLLVKWANQIAANFSASGLQLKGTGQSSPRCDNVDCVLRFTAPPGVGKNHPVLVTVGGQTNDPDANGKHFSYHKPIIFKVLQSNEQKGSAGSLTFLTEACTRFALWRGEGVPLCDTPVMMEVHGVSFGPRIGPSSPPLQLELHMGDLHICTEDDLCQTPAEEDTEKSLEWSATRPVPTLSKEALLQEDYAFFNSHTTISTLAPTGIGQNLEFSVTVGGQKSNALVTGFAAPEVKRVLNQPYNSRGQHAWRHPINDGSPLFSVPVSLLGRNMGPFMTNVTLTLNGRHCCTQYREDDSTFVETVAAGTLDNLMLSDGTISECAENGNAAWISAFPDSSAETELFYGHPYVSCTPPRDVVGVKTAVLSVAGQSITLARGLLLSRCYTELINGDEFKYYGTNGQLCAICPSPGAFCVNGSREEPVSPFSDFGFWRLKLDIVCDERSDEDGLGVCKEYRNVKHSQRALGEEHPRPDVLAKAPRCPRERWDLSLKRQFSDLKEEETCFDFAACRPKTSCLGNNTCQTGYEYTLNQCELWESKKLDGKANSGQGIGSYQCTHDWQCRTRSYRDPSPADQRPDGGDCRFNKPEDCAICVNTTNSTTGEVRGFCSCKPAERCSLCTIYEYYQFNGECAPCPESPELIFILFGLGVIGAIVMGKVLSNARFNLAFISIGVDYFQVLALFAYAKIRWPQEIKQLMMYFSIFNLNADLTAPECLMPNLEYEHKWYAYMAMPVVSTLLLAFYCAGMYSWKRFVLGQRKKAVLCSHAAPIVGLQLIMLYYMYMMLARRVFYIWNCVELDPSDGYEYTEFTSIECDGGMCRCWVQGGVQMRLAMWSIPAILLYVVGFPAYVLYIVKSYQDLIKEDQLLRALGLGDTRKENPFAHYVRVRYHRIYYHFKPSKTYWFLYVIFRKFWICTVGVVLREQPGFQLSVTMLVLFWCFWMQQKHRPFMSTVERAAVVANHRAKAREGVRIHAKIAKRMEGIVQNKKRSSGMKLLKKLSVGSMKKHMDGSRREELKSYFWDYNTVEACLLACAILVCLAGVMFESDRFQVGPDGEESKFAWQRNLITYCTILVIMGSLVYYGTVFLSETGVLEPKCLIRLFADKTKAIHREGALKKVGSFNEAGIEMSSNPMMRHQEDQQHRDRMARQHADELAAMAEAASKMQDALLKAKRGARANARPVKRGSKKQAAKKRTKFNQKKTGTEMTDEEIGIQMSEMNLTALSEGETGSSKAKKKKKKKKKGRVGGGAGNAVSLEDNTSIGYDVYDTARDLAIEPLPMYTNPSNLQASEPDNPVHTRSRSTFRKHQSAEGHTFFEDTETGETVWDLPDGGEVVEF
jgi:hypothetical protein